MSAASPLAADFIHQLKRAQRRAAVREAVRWAAQSLGGLASWGAAQIGIAALTADLPWIARVAWALGAGGVAFQMGSGLVRARGRCTLAAVAQSLPADPRDAYLTAAEIATQSPDHPFAPLILRQANAAFPSGSRGRTAGLGRKGILLATWGILGIPLMAWGVKGDLARKALWPFRAEKTGFRVTPGNATFPRGDDVAVHVQTDALPTIAPEIEVRPRGHGWERRSLALASPGHYTYVFRSLRDTLDYRARYEGKRSPRFRLIPFDPPRLVRLSARVDPPDHSGKPKEVQENGLVLQVLAGSTVTWTASIDPNASDARLEFLGPSAILERRPSGWEWSASVDQPQTWRLWARGPQGLGEGLVAEGRVDPITDAPPRVLLLGPDRDLQADSQDTLPFTAELDDDLGLKEVFLSVVVNARPRTVPARERLGGLPRRLLWERTLRLGDLDLKRGDRVEVRVVARDGRRPPGEGRSEPRQIVIADYAAAHEEIQRALHSLQRALETRRDEQAALRDRVGTSTAAWPALIAEQRSVGRRLASDRAGLEDLLKRMARDPRTDQGALWDYRGVKDGLQEIESDLLPRAERALQGRDPAAERLLSQAVEELDRLSRWMTQADLDRTAREVVREEKNLLGRAEGLARSIAGGAAWTEEERRQWGETVRAMQETMARIQERLKALKGVTSDASVDSAPWETLRFDRVSGALTQLGAALAKGDTAAGLAAAQEALAQLEEIDRQLAAGGAFGGGGAGGRADLGQAQNRMRGLIERQETLLEQTDALSARYTAQERERQSIALRDLRAAVSGWESRAARLGDVFSRQPATEIAWKESARLESLAFDMGRALAAGQEPAALNRLAEFHRQAAGSARGVGPVGRAPSPESPEGAARGVGPVGRAPSLESPEGAARGTGAGVNNDPVPEAHRELSAMAEESRSFLERLAGSAPEITSLSGEERKALGRWGQTQATLAEEARGEAASLAEVSRVVGLSPAPAVRNILEAAKVMESASSHLGSHRPRAAQGEQERSLDLLRRAEESLEGMAQRMSQRGASALVVPSLQPLGPDASTGDGWIPQPDESTPLRGLRDELMESMKERYPKSQEGVVLDYLRHWAK